MCLGVQLVSQSKALAFFRSAQLKPSFQDQNGTHALPTFEFCLRCSAINQTLHPRKHLNTRSSSELQRWGIRRPPLSRCERSDVRPRQSKQSRVHFLMPYITRGCRVALYAVVGLVGGGVVVVVVAEVEAVEVVVVMT